MSSVLALILFLVSVVSSGMMQNPSMKYGSTTNRVAHVMLKIPTRLHNRVKTFSSTCSNCGSKHSQNTFKISPTTFGGDPTGVKDSTTALQTCVQHCVNQSTLSPNGVFPGTYSFKNGKSIRDMGGCFIDLEGGEYRISSPITIPEYNANMQMGFGSIVAGPTFPANEFLVVIGKKGSCKVPQGSCNLDINFPDLFFDGGNRGNCLQINNVMGVTIGPGGYFLNFTSFGVQVNGGHEVMIDRCWLGETNFDFDFAAQKVAPNATAIQINGNDHYILNTIVFSSKIGIEINGAADYVTGTHVWFPINRALAFKDTMAFHITRHGNRFNGCYADGGRVVFEGDGLTKNMWTNGFECCAGSGLGNIPHGIILRGSTSGTIGSGLQIFANEFGGGSIWYESDSGSVPKKLVIKDVRIHQNSFTTHARGTRATKSITHKDASSWFFDFCNVLIFPQIASVRFSLQATTQETTFVNAMAAPPDNCTVTILTDKPFSGTVTVDVDSSIYTSAMV